MPLWLDMLRTPMAAPETAELKVDRRTWQLLCVACALAVFAIGPLVRSFGTPAAIFVAALLAVTAIKTAFYLARKKRADDAFLDAATRETE